MDIANIKYIYYRGISRDCNYFCSYCVFNKNTNQSFLDDQRYLNKFVNHIKKTKFYQQVSIMFTPYGEALNKNYYIKAMAKLSQFDNVAVVSCQTNGSFEAKEFIQKLKNHKANLNKIALWVTYHPEFVGDNIYDFANNLFELSDKIKVSVGVVGFKEYRAEIATLHNIIPPRVHYWINKPEQIKKQPSELFDKIDKNYHFENESYKCDVEKCMAGINSLFVKEKGQVFLCHLSKKSVGNLYSIDDEIVREKSAVRCDCYLTYSLRRDINFPSDLHKFRFKKT